MSDGGKNEFYKFPEWVNDVDSLARYWKLTFSEGNILKTLTARTGKRHEATDMKREYKKCLHYAVDRCLSYGIEPIAIAGQVGNQINIDEPIKEMR